MRQEIIMERFLPMYRKLTETTLAYLPDIVRALVIFLVGWVLSWIVATTIRAGLHRIKVDQRLARWLSEDETAKPVAVERWVGRGIYYGLMLVVLTLFFQALHLSVITEPLKQFLNQMALYAPNLLGAGALLVFAWLMAFLLKHIVSTAIRVSSLDAKLGAQIGLDKKEALALRNTVSDAAYWIVFLLFLPAVLGALAIEGLLVPVQELTGNIVAFLPSLFAAILILLGGWILARIVRRIVVGVAAALGIDRLGERVGLGSVVGTQRLSSLVGTGTYILILIPVLIASLNALELDAITTPASQMLNSILSAVPAVFSAALILTISYVVGRVMAGFVTTLMTGAGFNSILERLGLGRAPKKGQKTLSDFAGTLILVGIMLFAGMEAARQLGFSNLAELVFQFAVFSGKVIFGVVIFGLGLFLGNLASRAVQASGTSLAKPLAEVARASIVVLATAVGLQHMGVGEDIIKLAFGILLGAMGVAAAIAFGSGGRDLATSYLANWNKSLSRQAQKRRGRKRK